MVKLQDREQRELINELTGLWECDPAISHKKGDRVQKTRLGRLGRSLSKNQDLESEKESVKLKKEKRELPENTCFL